MKFTHIFFILTICSLFCGKLSFAMHVGAGEGASAHSAHAELPHDLEVRIRQVEAEMKRQDGKGWMRGLDFNTINRVLVSLDHNLNYYQPEPPAAAAHPAHPAPAASPEHPHSEAAMSSITSGSDAVVHVGDCDDTLPFPKTPEHSVRGSRLVAAEDTPSSIASGSDIGERSPICHAAAAGHHGELIQPIPVKFTAQVVNNDPEFPGKNTLKMLVWPPHNHFEYSNDGATKEFILNMFVVKIPLPLTDVFHVERYIKLSNRKNYLARAGLEEELKREGFENFILPIAGHSVFIDVHKGKSIDSFNFNRETIDQVYWIPIFRQILGFLEGRNFEAYDLKSRNTLLRFDHERKVIASVIDYSEPGATLGSLLKYESEGLQGMVSPAQRRDLGLLFTSTVASLIATTTMPRVTLIPLNKLINLMTTTPLHVWADGVHPDAKAKMSEPEYLKIRREMQIALLTSGLLNILNDMSADGDGRKNFTRIWDKVHNILVHHLGAVIANPEKELFYNILLRKGSYCARPAPEPLSTESPEGLEHSASLLPDGARLLPGLVGRRRTWDHHLPAHPPAQSNQLCF